LGIPANSIMEQPPAPDTGPSVGERTITVGTDAGVFNIGLHASLFE
jgi:hypothetical protein